MISAIIIIIAIKMEKEENGGYKIGEDLCTNRTLADAGSFAALNYISE